MEEVRRRAREDWLAKHAAGKEVTIIFDGPSHSFPEGDGRMLGSLKPRAIDPTSVSIESVL